MSNFANVAVLMRSHHKPSLKLGLFWFKCLTVTAVDSSAFRLLHFTRYWSPIIIAVGAVFAATKKRYALTDKPARELADGISGTEQNGDVRVAYEKALWKSKSDLMGAVVPSREHKHGMAESGYITCLACPMGNL